MRIGFVLVVRHVRLTVKKPSPNMVAKLAQDETKAGRGMPVSLMLYPFYRASIINANHIL